jgi:hypothetical protein
LSSELQNITIDFDGQRESAATSGKSVKESHDDPEQQDRDNGIIQEQTV